MPYTSFGEASKSELAVILAIVDFKPLHTYKLDFLLSWVNGTTPTNVSVVQLITWLEEDGPV